MFSKITLIRFLCCFLFFWGFICCIFSAPDARGKSLTPETIEVVDAVNRSVEISLPVKSVVTVNTASAVILRALGVDLVNTVTGVTTYITDNPRFWPELKEISPSIRLWKGEEG